MPIRAVVFDLGGVVLGSPLQAIAAYEREHGIAENTLYRWKSKYGGMEVSEAKRLRELQAENRRLKHLLGEAELDKAAMKEIIEGKW